MVSKASSTKGSSQAIDYIMNEQKQSYELCRNDLIGENGKEILKEFRDVQALNERCQNNTVSIVLSPSNDQVHTSEELKKFTLEHLKNLGLENHQYIAYAHQNTKTIHVHIIANRIDYNGKALNDSYIGYKAQHSAESIAQKHGLTSAKEVRKERIFENKFSQQLNKELKSEIWKAHNFSVKESQTFENYCQNMYNRGYKIHPSITRSGKIQGFRIEPKGTGLSFKASEIHKTCGIKPMLEKGIKFNMVLSAPLAKVHPLISAVKTIHKVINIGRSL